MHALGRKTGRKNKAGTTKWFKKNCIVCSKECFGYARKKTCSKSCSAKLSSHVWHNSNKGKTLQEIHGKEIADRMIQKRRARVTKEETKVKQSAALRGRSYEDLYGPVKAAEMRAMRSASAQQYSDPVKMNKHLAAMEKLWNDPEFQRKQVEAHNIKPNKPEIALLALLNEIAPGHWKYVGDYQFWIARKNPDFIDAIDKKIIEMFGDYWHKGEDPSVRIEHYAKYGYRTLVIWEHELEDTQAVKTRIMEF